MADDLLYWVRDAADSICGQTGAKTHQDKLHEAADEIVRLRALLVQAEEALGLSDLRWSTTHEALLAVTKSFSQS